jgi:hypothetical protein
MADVADVSTGTVQQTSRQAQSQQEMLRDLARRIRTVLRESNPAGWSYRHARYGHDGGKRRSSSTSPLVDARRSFSRRHAPGKLGRRRRAGQSAELGEARRVTDARGRGALLLMNDEVFLAREVTKSNTTRLNAFQAPEAGPAGVTDPDGIFFRSTGAANCPSGVDRHRQGRVVPAVDIVYSYIGADSTLVDALVAAVRVASSSPA